MSGAGDAAAAVGRDHGGEDGEGEHATSGEAAAMAEESATIAATTRRDSQVAAITFWGALKIPVSASDGSCE